jgi:hypothetical protein
MTKQSSPLCQRVKLCHARKAQGLIVARVELHAERFAAALQAYGLVQPGETPTREQMAAHATLLLAQIASHTEVPRQPVGVLVDAADKPAGAPDPARRPDQTHTRQSC